MAMLPGWRMRGAAAVAAGLGTLLAAPAPRALDAAILQRLPRDTRLLVIVDPGALRAAPQVAELLRLPQLLAGSFAADAPDRVRTAVVAFVPVGTRTERIVVVAVERATQEELERLARVSWRGAATRSWTPTLFAQGGSAALRRCAPPPEDKGLAQVEAENPAARLLAESGTDGPATLVYVSPDEAMDLHAMLVDLDRHVHFGMTPVLDAYKTPLRMLGNAHGLRLAMRQSPEDLQAALWLAMPNPMAAQIASVSLAAGAGMARNASDIAVRAGNMTPADARALDAVLGTLRTHPDGDLVRVTVDVSDSTTSAWSPH